MEKKCYFNPSDLRNFSNISLWQKKLGDQFFNYYSSVFEEGSLSKREKSLIALAVAHALQCPYCIDAYTTNSLETGADESQMMEAVHVAAAIRAGSTLVYGVQMMNQTEKLNM